MNYKGSYLEELTKEVTSISLEYVNFDRWGEVEYADDIKPLTLIRAPIYSSKESPEGGDYDNFINRISQHALNEITVLSKEVVERVVKRLDQLDKHIDRAWTVYFKHWGLFSDGKFSSLQFQWDFFHFFNIPITNRAGIMENPNFDKGITTDNFFWDLHDAMMYKQGAIKLIVSSLRIQLDGSRDQTEEQVVTLNDGEESGDEPKPLERKPPLSIKQLALIHFYLNSSLSFDEIHEMLESYGHSSVKAYENELRDCTKINKRVGKVNNRKSYTSISNNFKEVIQYLANHGKLDEADKASKDLELFKANNPNYNSF